MSQIKSVVSELERINAQITRNNSELRKINKPLHERKKKLEEEIQSYLSEKGIPGVKYGDKTLVASIQEKKALKPIKTRKQSVMEMLSSIGIKDIDYVYQEIEKAQRKDPVQVHSIKIEKMK